MSSFGDSGGTVSGDPELLQTAVAIGGVSLGPASRNEPSTCITAPYRPQIHNRACV
jgi:hypothetical protein